MNTSTLSWLDEELALHFIGAGVAVYFIGLSG
jgi:hypothetical protein